MVRLLGKIILPLIFWAFFAYVILQVPYPQTIIQASIYRLLFFFTTLFLAITFTLNIILGFIFISSSIALGIIFLLILKALGTLNIVTALLTIIATYLLFSFFKKNKNEGLTKLSKIPKLTHWRKHNVSS